MAKLTIDLPDALIEQLELTGIPLKEILPQALVEYLATRSAAKNLTQTRTWELCGSLTIATNESCDVLEETQELTVTNHAEHIDELLYQGF